MAKKIGIFILASILAFGMVGCDFFGNTTTTTSTTTSTTQSSTTTTTTSSETTTTTTTTESVESILARTANLVIISDSDNITQDFSVPAEVGDTTVTWSSNHPEYASVAQAATLSGEFFVYVVTITRPDQTTGDVTATLTATFHLGEATYDKTFNLRIRYAEDASIVTTIAQGLAQPFGTYLTWKDMTILGVGTDGFFFTDGTDVMFVYNASVAATVQKGEVYDITGGISLYNSIPEVQNIDTNLVSVAASDAEARNVEPVTATIDEIIANHAGYTADNPMEFGVYSVTGKVYYDETKGNYSTYIVLDNASTLDKEHAIRIYYKSNLAAVSAFSGQIVTLDIVLFGFNSGASYLDWYAYFFGTEEDIVAEALSDSEKLAISVAQVASSYEVTSSFALPQLSFGTYSNITISSEIQDYLSYADGSFSVVRPANDTAGTLSVTINVNAESQILSIGITMKAEVVVVSGDDIFISEYIEGSSYNKYIEIYNPLATSVDLSEYVLELYTNGATAVSNSLTLSGTLAPGDTVVISRPDATIYLSIDIMDTTKSTINFNGDDAIVLKHNGDIVDSIGKVGVDPGDYWGTGDITTQNHTLVRKSTVTGGDTNPYDDFDPSVEWDAYPIDTPTYLGSHTAE